jgi:hypothetical protein
MDKSKIPPSHLGSCRYLTLYRGVLDLSIIQQPFSITKCQTLISRFATFSSLYLTRARRSPAPAPARAVTAALSCSSCARRRSRILAWKHACTHEPHPEPANALVTLW